MSEQTTAGSGGTTGSTSSGPSTTSGTAPSSAPSSSSSSNSSLAESGLLGGSESESEEDEDPDAILFGEYGIGTQAQKKEKEKEKEKDTKLREPPELDQRGYLLIDGRPVAVNGCYLFWRNGLLYASAGTNTFDVTIRSTRVTRNYKDVTFSSGIARIGGDPLSLDASWTFRWGVAVADTDKYLEAAWTAYEELTELTVTDSQCYGKLTDVAGYPAHVSVVTNDVSQALRRLMMTGKSPAVGFLQTLNFHVTVEVYGRDDKRNPRVWQRGTGWTGTVGAVQNIDPATIYIRGENWLKNHR